MRLSRSSLSATLALTCYSLIASAKDLGNVFTSLDIEPESNTENLPQGLWDASLGITITDSMNPQNGDTFTLDIPNVYKVYGSGSDNTFSLKSASGDSLADCTSFSGTSLTTDSRVTCTITNANINQLASVADVKGQITLPFIFSAGGSDQAPDVTAAKVYSAGTNTVQWNGMTATVSFAAGPTYTPALATGYNQATDPNYLVRTSVNNEIQGLFLGSQCSTGSVTEENIEIDFAGFSRGDSNTGNLISWLSRCPTNSTPG